VVAIYVLLVINGRYPAWCECRDFALISVNSGRRRWPPSDNSRPGVVVHEFGRLLDGADAGRARGAFHEPARRRAPRRIGPTAKQWPRGQPGVIPRDGTAFAPACRQRASSFGLIGDRARADNDVRRCLATYAAVTASSPIVGLLAPDNIELMEVTSRDRAPDRGRILTARADDFSFIRWLGDDAPSPCSRSPWPAPHDPGQRHFAAGDRDSDMAKTTCGVLVTDRDRLVLGHATRSPRWDIPKGVAQDNEDFAQAAVRELRKETGLEATPAALKGIGVFRYLPGKDLALFLWHPAEMPDPAMLRRESYFNVGARQLPEFDKFAVCEWDDAIARVGRNMARVLQAVRQWHIRPPED
jgi:8-oxo-dGTP pyrophosphatase MutT (NUDIX family)